MSQQSEFLAKSSGLFGFQELAEELDGDSASLLASAGLSVDEIKGGDRWLSAQKIVSLLEITAHTLNVDTFGLQLSSKQGPSILGLLGLTMQQCQTVEEAIIEVQRFLHIHSQTGRIELEESKGALLVHYVVNVTHNNSERQLTDLSLAVGYSILKDMTCGGLPLNAAFFRYSAPTSTQQHKNVFKCPLHFNNEVSALAIAKSELKRPIEIDKHVFKDFMRAYLSNLTSQNQLNVVSQIRSLIRQLLPTGSCTLSAICDVLDIDQRTLQRRLREQTQSFQTLLNEERESLALSYLNETQMSLAQISELLGYSEQAVFTRSFKVWTGITPTQYMKNKGIRWKLRH